MADRRVTALLMLNAEYAEMTREEIESRIDDIMNSGYGGVMPCAWGKKGFLSERYFEVYGWILENLKKRRMKCVVWDEDGFPSGKSGAFLPERYRASALYRSVRKKGQPFDVQGKLLAAYLRFPDGTRRSVPVGEIQSVGVGDGCVLELYEMRKFTAYPMADYLNPEAVDALIARTRQPYYDRFSEYFGNTITGFFFDEPSMHFVENGRMISETLIEEFGKTYGYSVTETFPALFEDTGADAAAYRRDFFRLRAQTFSSVYVGRLCGWCTAHGVFSMGHFDQEEVDNPAFLTGDLLGAFARQSIPGVDEIWNYGRAKRSYKLVASSRWNYGAEHIHTEVFGAMGEYVPTGILYKECLDAFARGIDLIMPHGAWYDVRKEKVNAPPVLTESNAAYKGVLPELYRMCDLLSDAFNGFSPCADIAVYYPLDTLYADARFNEKSAYLGERNTLPVGYFETGEFLFNRLRRDFFYIHPDAYAVCKAEEGGIAFWNGKKKISFQTIIFSDTVAVTPSFLNKTEGLLDSGIKLIFVGDVPRISAEKGRTDAEIQEKTERILAHGNCRSVQSVRHYAFPGTVEECAGKGAYVLQSAHDPALGDFISTVWEDGRGNKRVLVVNSTDYPASGTIFAGTDRTFQALLSSVGAECTQEGDTAELYLAPRTYTVLQPEKKEKEL
ncbi:MAG: hypothetical protein ACI4SH_08395 [Candidatus Scatosoma sp.]